MDALWKTVRTLRRVGRKLGPYLLVEVLLPGGTLFALCLFLYRRRPALSLVGRANGRNDRWTLERCVDRPSAGRRSLALLCQE